MTAKQAAWFIIAPVALVAVSIWFNLAVLCQGDAKFSGACGGFGLYIPLWEIFVAPLPIAAILLEWWKRSQPPSTVRLARIGGRVIVVAAIMRWASIRFRTIWRVSRRQFRCTHSQAWSVVVVVIIGSVLDELLQFGRRTCKIAPLRRIHNGFGR